MSVVCSKAMILSLFIHCSTVEPLCVGLLGVFSKLAIIDAADEKRGCLNLMMFRLYVFCVSS